jgi:hypothetical protein
VVVVAGVLQFLADASPVRTDSTLHCRFCDTIRPTIPPAHYTAKYSTYRDYPYTPSKRTSDDGVQCVRLGTPNVMIQQKGYGSDTVFQRRFWYSWEYLLELLSWRASSQNFFGL